MESFIAEEKSKVRSRHLEIRSSLRMRDRKKLSARIINRLLDNDVFKSSDTIHTYVSMEKNREVDTEVFINTCLDLGKNVVVPRIKSNGELSHHKINSVNSLTQNAWGVAEPSEENELSLPDGILILVPMVASDFNLNRIGYGKGYYDRFLSEIDAVKVGLCYSFNLCWNPLPVEDFDIKMEKIVTEQFILQ